ncbi:MAG TPA: cytochrome c3 family protein, partial [Candidatus Eisenbacteria bacterium]|nr:cytochrome c3 family protein [Candidatus Eisenbacteria bacterium]
HVQAKGRKGLLLNSPHEPFARLECAKCHGTDKRGVPIAQGTALCFQCHETAKAWLAKPVVHQPLKTDRACLSCHGAHGGSAAPVLRREADKLCMSCHGNQLFKGKVRHAALDDGCASCHEPHAGTRPKLLKNDVNSLCQGCHDDLTKHAHRTSGGKDPRTGQPLTCVGCHSPHTSDLPSLLPYEAKRELCLQCHDPTMTGPKGR